MSADTKKQGLSMEKILLTANTAQGNKLNAAFAPEKGCNLLSFTYGDIELIDQQTEREFEATGNGLGALVAPHFLNRHKGAYAMPAANGLKKHAELMAAAGFDDPFFMGIARYATWKVLQKSENSFTAELSGKELWQETPLAQLEGQAFKLALTAAILPAGLELQLSVVSDSDSLIGIDYRFHLPEGNSRVISAIQKTYLDKGEPQQLSEAWKSDEEGSSQIELNKGFDCAFYPQKDPLKGAICLQTSKYQLHVRYECGNQENCWRLFRPEGASYVCISPLSAQNPWKPNLTVSSLKIYLQPEIHS